MKLAVVLALGIVVALPSLAGADILNPPSGPVDDEQSDVETMPVRNPDGPMRGERPGQMGQMRQRDPAQMAKRQKLRRALIEQFDANGDGRLGPRERMRAARTLRRIEQRLVAPMQQRAGQAGPANRAGDRGSNRYGRFMRRYDVNGDGQVGPREVPRGAADRLRQFDRNGDGWVERNELP